jgi:hypothetical protein
MYFLYFHKTKQDNQVFYVGIGKKCNGIKNQTIYRRAYDTRSRNPYWVSLVGGQGFNVEIVSESESREYIQDLEVYYISKFGRMDLGLGPLVNLTSGGDACLDKSKESILKQIQTSIDNGSFYRNIERLSKYKNKRKGMDSYLRKNCFLYDADGFFVSWFPLINDLAEHIKTHSSYVSKYIDSGVSIKEHFVFSRYLGHKPKDVFLRLRSRSIAASKKAKKRPLSIVNTTTGEELKFNSIIEMCKITGLNKNCVYRRIEKGVMFYKDIKIKSIA